MCNLACANCYIESTPTNDALIYLTSSEVATFLDEVERERLGTRQIGFTGGEPFMNPEFMVMLEDTLSRGFEALVLTNAMRPMEKRAELLLDLKKRFGSALEVRVSVDHFTRQLHETERGPKSWDPMLRGLKWLSRNGFRVSAAARTQWGDDELSMREGFRRFFSDHDIAIDADSPQCLVVFPEMDDTAVVPEITTACWGLLGVRPDDMMCATSRMVVRRKGESHPVVVACTLLPYEPDFELGQTLADALQPVKLKHRHCAKFCVLGGGACSVS